MYNHHKIEKKWQKIWEDKKSFQFKDSNNPKYYALDMFPYPSGTGLHVGHPKGYTATDIVSRYKLLNGFDVLHPIGWDAFGLPAEQFAIKTNNHPKDFTLENINNFRNQLKDIGFYFDYEKEVNTTDPKYFKWTQWIFTKLLENNLAELKDIEVNWCEGLNTVLANEEILINDKGERVSERGEFLVTKKPMKQWVLKITEYADKLLDGLEDLDWSESLKNLQRKWIGKTEGYNVNFKTSNNKELTIFNMNLEHLNEASFVIVSPTHELLNDYELSSELKDYIKEFKTKTDRDLLKQINKQCFKLDINAIHPITKKELPIYVSDYVVGVKNSTSHLAIIPFDKQDTEFAKLFKLNTLETKELSDKEKQTNISKYSKELNLELSTKYKLKDWLFSRQRYWGEPFPVYYDEDNNIFIEKNLPLLLPELEDFKPRSNKTPLETKTEWIEFELNNKKYKRDKNTMPQWAGSCWYYLAYILKQPDGSYIDLDSKEAKKLFERWLPVDLYIGGQEHAVLHLLYARFWHRFLYDINIVPTKEPFQRIINQGMILGENNEKMSKSKGNVINPDEIINSHGADSLRLYEMFMGPLTSSLPWKEDALDGTRKWLDRVYRIYKEIDLNIVSDKELPEEDGRQINLLIKNVSNNIENFEFNLAISNMMIYINHLYKSKTTSIKNQKNFLIILSIFCPHITEELAESFDFKGMVFEQKWPSFDSSKLEQSTIQIPVMLNNKLKTTIEMKKDLKKDEIEKIVLDSNLIKEEIKNKKINKIIIVINKIVNIIY